MEGREAASPPLVAVTAFPGALEGKNPSFKRKIFLKMMQYPHGDALNIPWIW